MTYFDKLNSFEDTKNNWKPEITFKIPDKAGLGQTDDHVAGQQKEHSELYKIINKRNLTRG
jgi:hypothetical protein